MTWSKVMARLRHDSVHLYPTKYLCLASTSYTLLFLRCSLEKILNFGITTTSSNVRGQIKVTLMKINYRILSAIDLYNITIFILDMFCLYMSFRNFSYCISHSSNHMVPDLNVGSYLCGSEFKYS